MSYEFLDKLNDQQYKAATIVDGYELMLAGAGTGKTHTLISRVAYLISQGISPDNILLLTFTNKAAHEMKERLVRDIGLSGKRVTAMTFHSFACQMLRQYQFLLHTPDYRIIDGGDDETLLRHLRKGYMDGKGMSKAEQREFPSVSKLRNAISLMINKQTSYMDVVMELDEESLADYAQECMELIDVYQAEKKKNDYLNFDDMLVVLVDLLKNDDNFGRLLSSRFTYIMCDEYQDTNRLQEMILTELTKTNKNLCVVGDDNQSIYRFRAADIYNILSFEERHPGCQVVPLTYNYRSTQDVLDVSNEMMKYAKEGIPKYLQGQCYGDKPLFVTCKNDKSAANYIVDEVVSRYRAGIPLSEQAVLVRKAMGSTYVEQECLSRGIPTRKYGGQKFLEQKNVKIVLSYMRLAVSDTDELAWRSILQEYPGIGFASIEKLIAAAKISGVDIAFSTLKYLPKSMRIYTSLADFRTFYDKFRLTTTIAEKLQTIEVHYSNLLDRQLKRTSSDKEAEKITKRMQSLHSDVQVLIDLAADTRSVSSFLDNLTLDMQKENEESDALIISTIHSAKGLEWDSVYLLHPVEDVFSDWNATTESMNEERRVMYVALTRAKNHLQLVKADSMMLNGKIIQPQTSSFLNYPDVMRTMVHIRK